MDTQRPPIILEVGSSVLRVGYAEQFKPQHIIPFTPVDSSKFLTESQWYSILSPLINQLYDRLMVKPTSRRVICVHSEYPQKSWEAALKQIFWNRGVPALTFVSSMEMVPVAQGWKRGLVVKVSREEAVCVAHVDGHMLSYTYQSVPCGYKSVVEDDSIIHTNWNDKMDHLWLDEQNPNSLVVALLKCLEACPRDVRRYVISNIVFSGDALVLVPDVGRRVTKRLKSIMEGNSIRLEDSSEQPREEGDDPALLTVVPIRMSSLKSLADQLSVNTCAPHRADLISWVGASLWAAVWHKYDDDETRISWVFPPTE
jgi:hypothetical protein